MKAKTKQTQDPPALEDEVKELKRTKLFFYSVTF